MENITVTRSSMPSYEKFTEMIKPLWETHWLTNMGKYHQELEQKLREYLDVPDISLMVNGHMALEMTLQVMDFPEGGEVITTPFTCASTTHAIIRNRLSPVFCDIKMSDYTIDEAQIADLVTEKTVAILPVHVYGNVCNVDRIQEIADRYGLKVIYDACHAFGETIKNGTGIGRCGDASVFSFHATKVFNTIEGGAAAFSDHALYDKLYNLKNFGIRGEDSIVAVGANAKMNEFCAVMGLCNLPDVPANIEKRKKCAERYSEALRDFDGVCLQKYDQEGVRYNYSYYPVRFREKGMRDLVYEQLRRQNIYARKYFYPLTSDAVCFQGRYDHLPLPNARRAADSILALPLYPDLKGEEQNRIIAVVKRCLEEMGK